jgi:hypothetical protein
MSALDQANGQWWWFLGSGRAKEVLAKRLVHAPRFGGTFAATGFDPKSERIALLDEKGRVTVCSLSSLQVCSVGDPLPQIVGDEFDVKSRNLSAVPSIGFVDGIEAPVVVSSGIIYYLVDGSRKRLEITDVVNDDNLSGFVTWDVSAGRVRITSSDLQIRQELVSTLRYDTHGNRGFVVDGPPFRFHWDSPALVPVISPSGQSAAAMYVNGDGEGVAPCDNSGTNGLPIRTLTLTVWSTDQRTESNSLCSTPLPQVRAGLGFSNDENWLGAFYPMGHQHVVEVYTRNGSSKPAYKRC